MLLTRLSVPHRNKLDMVEVVDRIGILAEILDILFPAELPLQIHYVLLHYSASTDNYSESYTIGTSIYFALFPNYSFYRVYLGLTCPIKSCSYWMMKLLANSSILRFPGVLGIVRVPDNRHFSFSLIAFLRSFFSPSLSVFRA